MKAKCPAHADAIASLSVGEAADGKVLLKCHAGCHIGDVLAAASLKFSDLFPTDGNSGSHADPVTYDYLTVDGQLAYQVCRFPPKDFRQRRPDGAGGWIWKMTGVKRIPYRLPDLANRDVVVVVEGEKDADRLWSVGIAATTNAGGAGKWGASESKALKACGVQRVVILPDNDSPGIAHAEDVAGRCKAQGLAASIIILPGLPAKGDVSDWLNAGHTADDVLGLIGAMPYVIPAGGHAALPAAVATEGGPIAGEWDFDPAGYHLTELGAATAFRDRHQANVRYDHLRNAWLVWDGHFWRPDADETVYRLGHEHALYWQKAALSIHDYDLRRRVVEWALKLEKRGAIENVLAMARAMTPIAMSGEQWDMNGWSIGVLNGVIDLKSGLLRPGDRDDFITQQASVTYDPDATCPRWEQFLDEVFDGNADLIDYVHKALGYSLTGDMREQCFFVAFGSGANGKSVWLDTIEAVWGTYGLRADMRIFAGSGEVSNFHLADFRGRRLIFAAEIKPNSRMNEHVVKNFTGGETLRVERKYGDPFTIRPCGKIWLGVNHRPKVVDDSFGFWRRVRLIPFLRTFTGSADDLGLRDTLKAESAGIMAWAVRGCLRWQTEGLTPPLIVINETEQYQTGEDPLADFFEQRTEIDVDAVVTFAALYAAYREWALDQGMNEREKLTGRAFGHALARRPFEKIKANSVVRYKGLRIVKPTLF